MINEILKIIFFLLLPFVRIFYPRLYLFYWITAYYIEYFILKKSKNKKRNLIILIFTLILWGIIEGKYFFDVYKFKYEIKKTNIFYTENKIKIENSENIKKIILKELNLLTILKQERYGNRVSKVILTNDREKTVEFYDSNCEEWNLKITKIDVKIKIKEKSTCEAIINEIEKNN